MKHALKFEIQSQPNDSSCGPTCLAAVYQYWTDPVDLNNLIVEIGQLSSGGTLAVQLASHALQRGYDAVITTYNLQLFDPHWFKYDGADFNSYLSQKLSSQFERKKSRSDIDRLRLSAATASYLQFLSLGGHIQMRALDEQLIVKTLTDEVPMLCGLSATYLYNERREFSQDPDESGKTSIPDDVGGDPVGHFVVLHGYDQQTGNVLIADPMHPNPYAPTQNYAAPLSKVVAAILLGIITYDANLLSLIPRSERDERHR